MKSVSFLLMFLCRQTEKLLVGIDQQPLPLACQSNILPSELIGQVGWSR
jgi:hypothetical protein